MPRPGPRALPLAVIAVVVLAAAVASWQTAIRIPRPNGPNDFNLAAWEVRHFPGKWIYRARHLFRGADSASPADVERYFDLIGQIGGLEQTVTDPRTEPAARDQTEAMLEADRRERDRLKPGVEAALEGRLTAVLEDAGLERRPPLLSWPHLVWPPVDVAFDTPPRVLAISPRDRIQLTDEHLVRGDLTVEQQQALEDEYQQRNLSALVAGLSGIGTYPVTVPPDRGYPETLELMSHEWLHNYLAFRPLGIRYYQSTDLSTINETVADIAGEELGALVAKRFPLQQLPDGFEATPAAPAPTPTPGFNPDDVLRQTRQDVEDLLAQGKVDEAESLMEQRRQELVDHGYYIRKLNQAYFAFHGQYADTGASIDPIGPKVQEIRDRSRDLGDFVRRVSAVTSRADLDRLLDQLRAESSGQLRGDATTAAPEAPGGG